MALYSVWDWNRNAYKVYQTSAPVSVGDDPLPPRPTNLSPIGANPDSDVKPLPRGVKFIGYDHMCRGEIRRQPDSVFDLGDDAGAAGDKKSGGVMPFMIGAGAVGLLWWWSTR